MGESKTVGYRGEISNYQDKICGEKPPWWIFERKDKTLALLQGCSTKACDKIGIHSFSYFIENDRLLT